MKLISHLHKGEERLAFFIDNRLYNTTEISTVLPKTMGEYLADWEKHKEAMEKHYAYLKEKSERISWIAYEEAQILSPLPRPNSFRDAYAFRQHVAAGRRNRGLDMIPEFDQFPVFYFSNPHVFTGPGEIALMKDHYEQLDYELEIAIIIGKEGRNIKAEDADEYIAGYMILNDWSARLLQMEEMRLNLGPAKGKDFVTSAGPLFVTASSLKHLEATAPQGHVGKVYDLKMSCKVNGEVLSQGNFKDMDWTFAEIIERCSYGVNLYPGDVIGSGTVGTGCLLELNGTAKFNNPDAKAQWLKEGDKVTMEIDELGVLENSLSLDEQKDYSLFALKK